MPLPRRKHIRLRNYDYREAGAYFITTCTDARRPLLSTVREDKALLKPAGELVLAAWLDIPNHHPHVTLDSFVVMPDHVHGVLLFGSEYAEVIDQEEARTQQAAPLRVAAGSLGAVVRGFKSASTRAINKRLGTPGISVWQRGYWDRVLRTDEELHNAREYIADNPRSWWEKRPPTLRPLAAPTKTARPSRGRPGGVVVGNCSSRQPQPVDEPQLTQV